MLAEYTNGDYKVSIDSTGTKIRESLVMNPKKPPLPESIDLKITDYCDLGCSWCHEKSTKKGTHGNMETILSFFSRNKMPGMEIAIGGGNPLDFPDLDIFLHKLNALGFIPNLTVNARHLAQDRYRNILRRVRPLIYGLGISFHKSVSIKPDSNTVLHVIAGVDEPCEVFKYVMKHHSQAKILILGYKHWGRGLKFYKPEVEANIRKWNFMLPRMLKNTHTISFDNLAINQLNLKNRLSPEDFQSFYMGDEGRFSMYIDGSSDQLKFARSSTDERISFLPTTPLTSLFSQV